jgi:hypothetical protein
MNNYSIIWKHFNQDSEIGNRLKAQDKFSLPYFIDGVEKENFEKKRSTSLNPMHLIKGLLVGYFDKPPETDTAFAMKKAKQILIENLAIFKSDSLEDMILDFAAHLRHENGHEASLQALMTGVELLPTSHGIKYDGSLDLYSCLEDNILKDRKAGILKLNTLIKSIDTSALDEKLLKDFELLRSDIEMMN